MIREILTSQPQQTLQHMNLIYNKTDLNQSDNVLVKVKYFDLDSKRTMEERILQDSILIGILSKYTKFTIKERITRIYEN